VYAISRPFGAAAQAGFGIGLRVVQAGFLPVVALGFAVSPVAGQNFGARHGDRVRATFRTGALMATGLMLVLTVICKALPETLVGVFTRDPQVLAVGGEYLRIISWNFVASGLVFVSSSMFQAMGNTIPSLVGSTVRILLVALPAWLLSGRPGFELRWVWHLSVAAVLVQMSCNLVLLRWQFRDRLRFAGAPEAPAVAASSG
jgi:Na+-driven multidrug efflux pump